MSDLSKIIGRVPVEIKQTEDEIVFRFEGGSEGRFYHSQDCCETVSIEDVTGDWNDLLNSPLLVAEERTSNNPPEGATAYGSDTWTFYTFRGIRGSVDVRWHGSSNGYYSESVDFSLTESQSNRCRRPL
jgi:hypothetical protein